MPHVAGAGVRVLNIRWSLGSERSVHAGGILSNFGKAGSR